MKVRKVTKAWRFPESSERQLSRSIQEMVDQISERAKQSVRTIKFDAIDDEIQSEENNLEDYAIALLALLFLRIRPIGITIYLFNSRQWLGVAKSAGGGKVPAIMLLDQTGPAQAEPWLPEKLQLWETSTQIALRKLVRSIVDDFSGRVRDMNLRDKKSSDIRKEIDDRSGVWRSWAANRARGIVGTWNSVLMRQRLKDAGVSHYQWRGQLDERERLQHLLWEGKIIEYNSDNVFPGEPYACRCWAQPKFFEDKR